MDYVLKAETGRINFSAYAFHRYARDFYKCRRDFVPEGRFSPIPYFLLCRAIELELKSRHLEQVGQSSVKGQFGHDLIRAYEALPAHLQSLSTDELVELQKASEIYKPPNKGFEYVHSHDAAHGYSSFPDLAILDGIAKKLLESRGRIPT